MSTDSDSTFPNTRVETANSISALFCECGSLRQHTDSGELVCTDGCAGTVKLTAQSKKALEVTESRVPRELGVLTDDESVIGSSIGFASTAKCPNCETVEEVSVTTRQLRAADEAPTRIFDCKGCGARWREDD